MVILEGFEQFLRQTIAQGVNIPLENTLSYVYTVFNLILQLFGFTLSAGL